MKIVLILVRESTPRHNTIRDFLAENLGKNKKVLIKQFSDITFEIEEGNVACKCGDLDLKNCSLVYFQNTSGYVLQASAIAYFLKKSNIKFVDESFENLGASGNKLNNIIKLAFAGVPVVPCFYASRKNLETIGKIAIQKFGLPIFVKSLTKQKREGIFLVEKYTDFNKLLKADKHSKGFLLQKYIDIAKEFRLVVMGEKIVALHEEEERRIKKNKIQVDSGESQSGWLDASNAPKIMRKVVIGGTKALNLNISGADACIERKTGKIYVFEINRGPGLTLDPQISPELPELAKYFRKLIK